jgi:uroporphyrinogen III methyltransferase/synthase
MRQARKKLGKVYLVGAGPGDPSLLTLKARRLLETADVVVFDRLVDDRIIAWAKPGADFLDVGKQPRAKGKNAQADINALLVAKARLGKAVVRLKGGDPFVFGRGGEEALALAYARVPFEVVPGVSSAVAAPAYAGIPVTHRGLASSVTVVTGSEDPGKPASALDWHALANIGGTLIILMGRENLRSITGALTEGGLPSKTPVALVRWGTKPQQRTLVGTLGTIADAADAASIEPPVVAVVGDVVRLQAKLDWFESQPLFGKRILVTRTRTQAGTLSQMLAERGALPIEVPTIELKPLASKRLDTAIKGLSTYAWVVMTSANAVDILFGRMEALGRDARALHGVAVAAIGPATAERLRGKGIVPDLVPDEYVSEAVVKALAQKGIAGKPILLPRSDIGRDALTRGLQALGAKVDEIPLYRNVAPAGAAKHLKDVLSGGVDVATFTSSSTVHNLAKLLGGDLSPLSGAAIACIGPVTAETARELGLKVAIVAKDYTVPGLVTALERHFFSRKRR